MKNDDFLLSNDAAKRIYNAISALPIIDYHCHLDAKEIYENKPFATLTDAWLAADHYKWRAMRYMGIPELTITGDAPKYDKFVALATIMPYLIGHPLYHFCHLELKNYFGITEQLNKDTAAEIYKKANGILKTLTPHEILNRSNVEAVITTNDPTEDLRYHKLLRAEKKLKTRVLPAFRPDKAVNIEKDGFTDYLTKLASVSGQRVSSLSGIKWALIERLDYFAENGAVATDHGTDYMPYVTNHAELAETAVQKAFNGTKLSKEEADGYKTHLLLFLASEYHKRKMVMEIHFGVHRNTNTAKFQKIGADSGFDVIRGATEADNIIPFLNKLHYNKSLPKTVIFSLNPNDNAVISAATGSFQAGGAKGYVQQGAAWWFNDTKNGIREHLKTFSETQPLDIFLGMLTDSRSLLSYARHEYFRRILSDFLGGLIENGEYHADAIERLEETAKNISYYNVKSYFNL